MSRRRLPMPADAQGAVGTVALVLVFFEVLAFTGLQMGWPLLGDYYEGYGLLSLALSGLIACVSLGTWYWIVNRSIETGPPRLGHRVFAIPAGLLWFVLVANAAATLAFDYAAVGYAGGAPFAFLLTALPLEPLLVAYLCQRRKFVWPPVLFYAGLGLVRGWTGHLFILFILYLLLSDRRKRITALLAVSVALTFVFEPLMQLRALVRGFDDSTGLLLHRLASRISMTPISDFSLNMAPLILACDGQDYMDWTRELIYSVIPRSLFGIGTQTTVHGCLAILATGDPNTELTFSTTLAIKTALVSLRGIDDLTAFITVVALLIALQVWLAKRQLQRGAYVYTSIFLYQFFLSGVMRDLALPVYFMIVVQLAGLLLGRAKRKPSGAPTGPWRIARLQSKS